MSLKFWEWLVILFFGCLTFFYFRGADTLAGNAPPVLVSEDARKMILFIIDFRDFSCPACLDSFLTLYHNLPMRYRTTRAWGILAVESSGRAGEEDGIVRIAEKKLKGFIRANRITFPFLVDRYQVFDKLATEGSSVLLFDESQKAASRYDFPLSGEQYEEIFELLNEK